MNHTCKIARRILTGVLLVCVYSLSVLAQEKAIPKVGEGIKAMLNRYSRPGTAYQKQFIELNKQKLGKDNSLRLGVTYLLPPLKENEPVATPATKEVKTVRRSMYEPLFGKQLAEYDIVSTELSGACFYVVCGHGGPDPGAIGRLMGNELHEDEYAYDIALRLARNLLMRGANIHFIIQDAKDGIRDEAILQNSKRETCMGDVIPLNQIARLKQRSDKINTLYWKEKPTYSRSIFIHVDSRGKGKQTDVFFYHSKSKESKRLATEMKSTFANKYRKNQPGRGFKGTVGERSLYVLNNTIPTGLYVELGNIQNNYDQQRIVINNNRQALANWLCEGFITDYKHYKK